MKYVISILCQAALCMPALAGNCAQRVVQHQVAQQTVVANTSVAVVPQNFLAVPVAVPVAIPVAPYSAIQYQAMPQAYQAPIIGQQQAIYGQQQAMPQQLQASPAETTAAAGPSLIAQACAKCHNGNSSNVKAREALVLDGAIDDSTRVSMIERLMTDDLAKRMPPGKTLDAATLSLLIQEISQRTGPSSPPAGAQGVRMRWEHVGPDGRVIYSGAVKPSNNAQPEQHTDVPQTRLAPGIVEQGPAAVPAPAAVPEVPVPGPLPALPAPTPAPEKQMRWQIETHDGRILAAGQMEKLAPGDPRSPPRISDAVRARSSAADLALPSRTWFSGR